MSKPIRILIFNWRDTRHAFAGGAEVYVHELAKRWVKAGHHVAMFCGNDGRNRRYETIDGVKIVRRGGFYLVYAWAFVYYWFKFRGRYDVVIDSTNGIPFFTPLYVREPVVCVMYHVHQEIFRRHLIKPLAALAAFLEKRMMPLVYRNSKFITISESSKRDMLDLQLDGAGVSVIPCGVDLSTLKPAPKSQHPSVLYLGRLKAYKSVGVLLKAFKVVLEIVPKAKLVVAGSGEEQAKLKRQASRLGIKSSVEFRGKVTEAEKVSLLQQAWLMVNPSFVEGWGMTTIEANACGTPTVGSNVAGLKDSIQNPHTGYLVAYGDHQAFANRISELLTQEQTRKQMSQQAVKWAKGFSWQKSSAEFFEMIGKEVE